MLIGAVHGQELEGTAALLNLISLLETGKDLRVAKIHWPERYLTAKCG